MPHSRKEQINQLKAGEHNPCDSKGGEKHEEAERAVIMKRHHSVWWKGKAKKHNEDEDEEEDADGA